LKSTGLLLVVFGLAIAGIGLLVWSGVFAWFGKLPGDIRIERFSVRIFIPITSMLIVSVALSFLFYLIRKLH